MADNAWRIGGPVWIFSLDVEEGARLLLARLWGFADHVAARAACAGEGPDPYVWPCRDRLAAELRTSDRTIRRRLTALEEAGALRREARVIDGRRFDGLVLVASEPVKVPDTRTPASAPPDAGVPPGADICDRQPGRQRPPPRTSVTGTPDASVPHITPRTDPSITPENGARSAKPPGSAREDEAPADDGPAPLRLELEEPDRLDPERCAVDVLASLARLRRELGARTRSVPPSAKDLAAVASAERIAGRPIVELAGGVLDLRTHAGRIAFWTCLGRRKAEELRQRSERGKGALADLAASWLTLRTLARDGAELLGRDDLDDRRPAGRARASPQAHVPVNGTDLLAHFDAMNPSPEDPP